MVFNEIYWVDDYIFSDQWVLDNIDLNSIFFARTPGTLTILYKTSVLIRNCEREKWKKLKTNIHKWMLFYKWQMVCRTGTDFLIFIGKHAIKKLNIWTLSLLSKQYLLFSVSRCLHETGQKNLEIRGTDYTGKPH